MSTETPTILTDLLNRIEAILDCGAATTKELGEYLLPEQDTRQSGIRVAEWIRSRKRTPQGDTALKMMEWASQKTLEITKARKATKYNKAFRSVESRRSNPKA